jgi:hypothetical protein
VESQERVVGMLQGKGKGGKREQYKTVIDGVNMITVIICMHGIMKPLTLNICYILILKKIANLLISK